mmetsp:Transcript_9481/g.8483  ORF Transcript_9481/g.8483 Transcript_9481/m.8483 type:complete len:427 (+) Transcript_9481:7-1287(+)
MKIYIKIIIILIFNYLSIYLSICLPSKLPNYILSHRSNYLNNNSTIALINNQHNSLPNFQTNYLSNKISNHPIDTLTIYQTSDPTNSTSNNISNYVNIDLIANRAVATASKLLGSTTVTTANEQMSYFQTMFAGAISRTIAQTVMHPANTYKTLLQLKKTKTISGKGIASKSNSALRSLTLDRLLRGADAQFLLSLPHGAFHFFVIEQVKSVITDFVPKNFNFLSDFIASSVSTVVCSVVSTPQMVLTDRLMAGIYPSLPAALTTIYKQEGMAGFYSGWWPALAQKIPSYGLTWVFFQELKRKYEQLCRKKATGETSFILGAVAAAASVSVMIPMDTVKTRLVTQLPNTIRPYTGVTNAFYRIFREEGIGAFYSSLPPRLASVVPMIAIQFGVYEAIKLEILRQRKERKLKMTNQIYLNNNKCNTI